MKWFQAYLCHILALVKHPDENLMARLTENSEMLDQEAIIHLARAWILYGDVGEGRKLLAGIERPRDFRAACFGLVAWLELDPQSPMVMRFKRYIDDFRRPGMDHWGTTQDNALAIYALAAYDRRCPSVGNQRFALELSAGDAVSVRNTFCKRHRCRSCGHAAGWSTTHRDKGAAHGGSFFACGEGTGAL